MGVTVTVAAGDNGSADGLNDQKAHVDFPASSPYALACGGTRLEGSGSTIASETVWNDGPNSATGGGVSDNFPLPSYQANANVPVSINPRHFVGRGVPDVAGDADPESGYEVRVDGSDTVVGGTSAVAPLWAGLIALFNQQLGNPVGFVNPLLYNTVASSSGAFHQITEGSNGAFKAGQGWNACTGLGSADGSRMLAALGGTSGAGSPTASTRSRKA
jgi:kumamolisin